MTHEQQTAKKIIQIMEDGVSWLNASTIRKLAAARQHSVAVAAEPVHVAHAATIPAGMAGRFLSFHAHGHRSWLAALVLLTLALLALLAWQQISTRTPVETDTLLLASDLPPEAYADKGFHAWLENSSQL